MATTSTPARSSSAAGPYPLLAGARDEAFAATDAVRTPYAPVMDTLARHDLVELRGRVRSNVERLGLSFGAGVPMAVDPVPRVIAAAEWGLLEAALRQRARALNAFVLDAYSDQLIFAAGIVPRRLLETSSGWEPAMRGLLDPDVPPATVAGMDLVREGDDEMRVLEDNLRMPSGATYAIAVREAVVPALAADAAPRDPAPYVQALAAAIRAAGAARGGEPAPAILTDGPESGAYYEHERLAAEMEMPLVEPGELETARGRLYRRTGRRRSPVDILYRRLDADRITDADGSPTPLGELLGPALRSGRLRLVNALGTGLADDKLAHAYVEEMIRFYLGEEAAIRSVPSYDLSDESVRAEVLPRLEELVVKPREGFGGHGVTIMPAAGAAGRRRAIGLVRRRPEGFVAQEPVSLSTHPTVVGPVLRPRRVDLRPYVISAAEGETVMAGGLTRYARAADELIVNSSQGGGCKDTWVLPAEGAG